jgi:hypothetical protein
MYFPSTLPFVTLYNTLHTKGQVTRDRLRYFIFAFIAVFIYQVRLSLRFVKYIRLILFADSTDFIIPYPQHYRFTLWVPNDHRYTAVLISLT